MFFYLRNVKGVKATAGSFHEKNKINKKNKNQCFHLTPHVNWLLLYNNFHVLECEVGTFFQIWLILYAITQQHKHIKKRKVSNNKDPALTCGNFPVFLSEFSVEWKVLVLCGTTKKEREKRKKWNSSHDSLLSNSQLFV